MKKREKYYYTFHYVDGTKQEFEKDDDGISSLFLNPGRDRIQVDNELINLDNVIKVTVETKSQRDEKQRISNETARSNAEAIKSIRF